MTIFTNVVKQNSEKFFKKSAQVVLLYTFGILLLAGFWAEPMQAQQHTDNNKDMVLRGGGRVNPSTLGLEINIPLGNYKGRGIDLPVSLSYSSKLWRTEFLDSQSRINNPEACIQINKIKYAERSAAGWTSSLAAPYIEYTGLDNVYDERGFALSPGCAEYGTQPSPGPDNAYVKRIMIHLPGGESHELRANDSILISPPNSQQNPSFDGTFYSVDGTNLRYVEDSASGVFKLRLPDGSFYDFSPTKTPLTGSGSLQVRKATRYQDRNANSIEYDAASGQVADTVGRIFQSPLGLAAPDSPTGASTPVIYNLPGLNGSNVTFKFHWKRLNGGSQAESALTDIYDPAYQLKYMADRASSDPNTPPRSNAGTLFTSQYDAWVHDANAPIFNPVVLTKIELPTGTSYDFTYDIYGRIEKIVYPTGGIEKISYGVIPTLSPGTAENISNQTNFGVTSRKVYRDVNSEPYEWSYSAAKGVNTSYKITIVSPEGITSERYLHIGTETDNSPTYGSFGYEDALAGMTYDELVFDGNNSLVSRVRTFWTKTQKSLVNAGGNLQKADWHPRVSHTERFVYDSATGTGLKAVSRLEYESDLSDISEPVLLKKTSDHGFENAGNASQAPGYGAGPNSNPPNDPPVPQGELLRVSNSTFLINDSSVASQVRQNYRDLNLVGLKTAEELLDSQQNVVSRTTIGYDEPAYASGGIGNPTTTGVWDDSIGPVSDPSAYLFSRQRFDHDGNVIEKTDPLGNKSYVEFETVHNAFPKRSITPAPDQDGSNGANAGLEQQFSYDAVTGLLMSSIDPNGLETRYEYKPGDLRLQRSSKFSSGAPVGGATEYNYVDTPGAVSIKLRRQVDAQNWTETTKRFDGLGRLKQAEQSDSGGAVFVDKEYNSDGRVSRVSNPFRSGENREWTTNEYDDVGRIKRVIGPDGSALVVNRGVLVSDRKGVRKTITDQTGRSRTGISNALGQMFRVIEDPDGEGLETDYVFDTAGRVRKTVQGQQQRYFMFDSVGRLIYSKQPEEDSNPSFQETDPVTGNSDWSKAFAYDSVGNTTGTTDARNISVAFEYDALSRLVRQSYSDDTPEVTLFYDGTGLGVNPQYAKGSLSKVSSSVSESRFVEFDLEGRILRHEQVTAGTVYGTSYEYSLAGNLVAETYPSGRRMEYGIDNDGLLESVSGLKPGLDNPKTYLDGLSRNAAGQLTESRLGNGRFESFSYNSRQQITGIGLGYSVNESGLLQIDLGYGNANQNNGSLLTQKIDFSGLDDQIIQSYSYDSLNRISSAREAVGNNQTWQESFSYDRYGNRTYDSSATNTISQLDKTTNPSIDSVNNRIGTHQDGDALADYVYDKAGNLVADAQNRRFVYSGDNRINAYFKGLNTSSTPDAAYEYDGEGNRIRKIESGKETVFVYNAVGKLIAEYSDKLPESPNISYLTKDHLGSTRVVTDGAGTVVSRQDYMAFGENLTDKIGNMSGRTASQGYGSDVGVRKQYTGYERDEESGLDFAKARYYNSNHGRFTSVDPLTASANLKNPQTFNRYSYVLNSPHKFVDPLGLISQSTGACGQFCSNSNTSGSTEFDSVSRSARSGENFFRRARSTPAPAPTPALPPATGNAPRPLIAEATERFINVSLSQGGVPMETGILQMTEELSSVWLSALNNAYSAGVEVGALAKAVSGVTVVTGISEDASREVDVEVSGDLSGPGVSVSSAAGKGGQITSQNLAVKAVEADIVARTELTKTAEEAAGQFQDMSFSVSTSFGAVEASATFGFFQQAFSKEMNLIYRRGIQSGFRSTSGPGVTDQSTVQ